MTMTPIKFLSVHPDDPLVATGVLAITPDDTNQVTRELKRIYVGSAGNVKIEMHDGTNAVIPNVPAGTQITACITKVLAAGTTATNIVGFY